MSDIKILCTDCPRAPIEKFIPYVNNARTHSPEQITKLRSIFRGIGFAAPIEVDEDFSILSGHGRLEAAKAEGMTELPYVMHKGMAEADKKAYILEANRSALDAGWDEELLSIELQYLNEAGYDMSLTAFDEDEWMKLLDPDEGEATEDDFDVDAELEKPAFSKPGDIWHLGKHRVICGDSTDPETYRRLIGDTKVNLVLTDAPYFVNLEGTTGKIKNDDLQGKEAYEFLMKAFTCFREAMAKDASIYEFYATSQSRVFFDAFDDAGFKLGAGLVWHKDRAPLMRTDWKFDFEPIMFGWRKDGKHNWYGDQKQKTCIEGYAGIHNAKKEGYGHPSSKPVPLLAYLMQQSTQTNGIVLDGFLGSASTLIACEQMGRVCYGIEITEKFVDVAVERFRASCPDAEISVERDGETIPYADVPKPEEGEASE